MIIFRSLLAIAIFTLLFLLVDFRQVFEAISGLSLYSILVLALISYLLIAISVVKWRLFLNKAGQQRSFNYLFKLYLVGYFINLVMPSYIGGDIVRGFYAGAGQDLHKSISATFLERYTGLAVMIIMSLVALLFSKTATISMALVVIVVALLFFLSSLFLSSKYAIKVLRYLRLSEKLIKSAGKIQESFSYALSERSLIFKALLLSILFHLTTILNTWAVSMSLGWYQASLIDLATVVPLILIISAIPMTPQGLGVQEGAFYFFLTAIGYPNTVALAIPVVLRAKSYILALLGGVFWLQLTTHKKE